MENCVAGMDYAVCLNEECGCADGAFVNDAADNCIAFCPLCLQVYKTISRKQINIVSIGSDVGPVDRSMAISSFDCVQSVISLCSVRSARPLKISWILPCKSSL